MRWGWPSIVLGWELSSLITPAQLIPCFDDLFDGSDESNENFGVPHDEEFHEDARGYRRNRSRG